MKTRFLLLAAALALACGPAFAAVPLQVSVNGFQRVVPYSTGGDTCDVLPLEGAPTTVTCPDGSKGTLTLYGTSEDAPVCEVDFWSDGARWHAIVSHQNGNCALHWSNPSSLQVTVR